MGLILFVAGWWIMILALKENGFAALAVKHLEGQKVIASGVYGVVRHPMYAGAVLLRSACRCGWSRTPGLCWRIQIEEEFLRRELQGYDAYMKRVRYRLIPFLW